MSTTETNIADYCKRMAQSARDASRTLAQSSGSARNRALRAMAELLRSRLSEILAANAQDIDRAPSFGLTSAQIDRLKLNESRVREIASAVEQIALLPDPIGKTLHGETRPNGLNVRKVSVPLGVIFFIYESRPNVTIDAAALAVKSGNAVILRGGKEAHHSNQLLADIARQSLHESGLPRDAVVMVDIPDREAVGEFLSLDTLIDVAIPRGGEGLIRRVAQEATMPVIKHFQGINHVYVHRSADVEKAVAVTEDSKCQRPGTCNAAETLLIDADIAEDLLPRVAQRLIERGVELRGCPRTRTLIPSARPASDEDFRTEHLDLIMNVRVVADLAGAVDHIRKNGSGHTDVIVTEDLSAAESFLAQVDSAAVMVNASSRFHDGGEFGLGAEIGISTDKFHARGPCGLDEICSYKWLVVGNGQTRAQK